MLQGRLFFSQKANDVYRNRPKSGLMQAFLPTQKVFFFTDKRKTHVFQVGHMERIVINTKSLLQQLLSGLIYYCYVRNVFKTDIKI